MIEAALINWLSIQSALVALVSTRIEPVQNVQRTTLPAVSYQVISGPVAYSQDGQAMRSVRIQLTTTASTYASLLAVCDALRTALAGRRWTYTDGDYVSFVENEMDGLAVQSGQAGYYLRRMDVVIQH